MARPERKQAARMTKDFGKYDWDASLLELPMFATYQPSADAILYGRKNIENRPKPIPKSYGLPCRVLMAAPTKKASRADSDRIQSLYPHNYDKLKCSLLLAVVEFVDCVPYDKCKNETWASPPSKPDGVSYCWKIGRVVPFVNPITIKCGQGWKYLTEPDREAFCG